MDLNLNNLPPMKRFRLLHQEITQKPEPHLEKTPNNSPISPSRLPTKKRKQSRSNDENILPPTPFCLPAKKRIWAFQPEFSPLSNIDLNLEIKADETEKKELEEEEDGIMCAVCESTDGDPIDPIVFCDGCDLMVHATCYGSPLTNSIPDGSWFCNKCSSDNQASRLCCLCPVIGGALKQTNDGKWAHIVCAVLVPEVFFQDPEGRDGIVVSKVPERRWNNEGCYLCKKMKGCVLECSEPKCGMAFHVTCGLKHDLCIELNQGRKKGARGGGGGIVAAFCQKHTAIWEKQQQTGKFKIVARNEE